MFSRTVAKAACPYGFPGPKGLPTFPSTVQNPVPVGSEPPKHLASSGRENNAVEIVPKMLLLLVGVS